jgi:hypothetical protein
MSTKAIVSNKAALTTKYAATGVAVIEAALDRYQTHFQSAGDTVQIIYLDDAVQMAQVGAPVVSPARTDQETKASIDAVFTQLNADVLIVLGGPEIVPHQILSNPTADDDTNVPSDLPYACVAPYGSSASAFAAPSRIVGRFPDITAQDDQGAYLAGLLDAAVAATATSASAYSDYFAVSADVWSSSTATSLTSVFGTSATLVLSPPDGPGWSATQYAKLTHFANLHGANNTPQWFGQKDASYPIAMDSANVTGQLQRGTVIAVEACYGAQLYNPALAAGSLALCNVYLSSGALGFFGSTNIAYGDAVGNDAADLLTQYFLAQVLMGRSLGAAALAARQQFVSVNTPLVPSNIKTLAQFLLLGDPSIALVSPPPTHALDARLLTGASQIQYLRETGEQLAREAAFAVPLDVQVPASVGLAVKAALGDRPLIDQREQSYVFQSPGTELAMKTLPSATMLHVTYGKTGDQPKIRSDVIVEVLERDGHVISVKTLYAR